MIGAMTTMNMTEVEQSEVIQLVSAILHLGNVMFREEVGEKAIIDNDQCKTKRTFFAAKISCYIKLGGACFSSYL